MVKLPPFLPPGAGEEVEVFLFIDTAGYIGLRSDQVKGAGGNTWRLPRYISWVVWSPY